MRKLLLLVSFLLAACATAACGGSDNKTDGGDARADGATDASGDAQDAGGDASTRTGRRCVQDSDCGGSPFTCNRLFPGGFCTRMCTRDRDCGTGYLCEPSLAICLKSCQMRQSPPNCEDGTVCLRDSADAPPFCWPSCYVTPPANVPACVSGMVCDPYSAVSPTCLPADADGGLPAHTGADNGEPCTTDTDCKSRQCYAERNSTGAPTGYLGGICFTNARVATSGFGTNQPLPVGSCPPGFFAAPYSGNGGGDFGICLKKCTTSSQCRPGYVCNLVALTNGTNASEGTCDPIPCNSTPYSSQPNHGCPDGTACETQPLRQGQTVPTSICVRPVSDGGVGDAGTDAATGDAQSDATTGDA